jgi:NAD(P)-dependent dehydrogenase (short-subunit alcohol dehydrogenase family)
MRYAGKAVLVTGGAAGIGLGIARAFLEEGATVLVGDFRPDRLEQAVALLAGEFGDRVVGQPGDVRDAAQVGAMFDALQARAGRLDVAVSNAGIYPNRLVIEMDEEEWDRVFDTNMKGTFLVCREAARRLVAQGTGGNIITISSGAARGGRVTASHYCASKAGVTMFSQILAVELARYKIRVNCIAPSMINTTSEVNPLPAWRVEEAEANAQLLLGRMCEPRDIANAALFLASDEASFITGEMLGVTGGSGVARPR